MTTYRFTGLNAVAAQHLVEASALDTLIGLRQTLDGDAYEVNDDEAHRYASSGERALLALLETIEGGPLAFAAQYLDEPNKEAVLGAVGRLFGMRVLTMREVGR